LTDVTRNNNTGGEPRHKDNETHKEEPGGIKGILHNWTSGGHPRRKIWKVLIRIEVLEIL
jgi:hypothetical protein